MKRRLNGSDRHRDQQVADHAPPHANALLISNRQGYAQAANYAIHIEAVRAGLCAVHRRRVRRLRGGLATVDDLINDEVERPPGCTCPSLLVCKPDEVDTASAILRASCPVHGGPDRCHCLIHFTSGGRISHRITAPSCPVHGTPATCEHGDE